MSWEAGHPQRERLLIDLEWPTLGLSTSREDPDFGPHYPGVSSGGTCLDKENTTLKSKAEYVASILMCITLSL